MRFPWAASLTAEPPAASGMIWLLSWLAERIFKVFKVFNVFKVKVVILLRTSLNFMKFDSSWQSKKHYFSKDICDFLLCRDSRKVMKLTDVLSKINTLTLKT